MSGAHCIDFYNKSTLTFIVLYLCFSSCFFLHCHLLNTSAAPVCSCRVLWGGSQFQDVPWWWLGEAASPGAVFCLYRVCRGAPAAPGLAAWTVVPAGIQLPTGAHWEGSGSFLPQQQQLGSRWGREPPLGPCIHCPWAHRLCLYPWGTLIPGICTAALTAVCGQESLLLHTAVHTGGCFFSEPNSLYFMVRCCEFIESDQGF